MLKKNVMQQIFANIVLPFLSWLCDPQHNDVQLLLAQAEKNYFETKLKLDRVSGEKQAVLEENRILEDDRNTLRHKLKELTEENVKIMEK